MHLIAILGSFGSVKHKLIYRNKLIPFSGQVVNDLKGCRHCSLVLVMHQDDVIFIHLGTDILYNAGCVAAAPI